jgi:hypothetical protein
MEQWKDIPGLEGFYQASTEGRIRSIDRIVKQRNNGTQYKRGKILSPAISGIGYCVCALSKENKLVSYPVHRLIAMTWLGFPPPNMYEVNHLDGNKQNNNYLNLEWSNRVNNLNHSIAMGLMKYNYGENHHNSKFTNKQREEILYLRNSGGTLVEIAELFNVFPSTISRIVEKQIKIKQ